MSDSLTRLRNRLTGNIFGSSNQSNPTARPQTSRGAAPNFDTSHFGPNKDKYEYGVFQYPEDLGNNDHGHYMLFHIHERQNSKYVSPQYSYAVRGFQTGFDTIDSYAADIYDPADPPKKEEGLTHSSKPAYDSDTKENFRLAPGDRPGVSSSATMARKGGFKKSKDTIALYMPNNLQQTYKVNYNNSDTGVAGLVTNTLGGNQNMKEFLDNLMSNETGRTIASTVGEVLGVAGFARISGYFGAGDVAGQFRKNINETPNPALEAIFQSVDFREFSYSFRFTPRSENEVRVVDDIIRLFKFHAAPERMAGEKVGRHFRFPSEFDIFYMYQGTESKWYPMLHTCVLNNVDVTYGPGNETQHFRAVDGSPAPTEINLSLRFTETEVNTKEFINLGF